MYKFILSFLPICSMNTPQKHPKRFALILIFVISLIATLGSLYYSYRGDFFANIMSWDMFNPLNALQPCALCRYQRIALYPIAFLSWVALWKKDYNIVYYITPMAIVWALLALYQYGLEQHRVVESQICGVNPTIACDGIPVQYWWFITLPLMSFVIFIILIVISYNIIRHHKKHK